jgi:hypothetical protein
MQYYVTNTYLNIEANHSKNDSDGKLAKEIVSVSAFIKILEHLIKWSGK